MRNVEPVLMQPRPKKSVRIAPKHVEKIVANDVIRKPPKPKDSSFSSFSNIKPKIIIPPRKFAGYVDLANEVRHFNVHFVTNNNFQTIQEHKKIWDVIIVAINYKWSASFYKFYLLEWSVQIPKESGD